MEAILLIGIQATGKSTFCRQRLADTHIRINLDMLKTRHREEILVRACLDAKQPFVVDNTNASREERARYIGPARATGFRVVGYYFSSRTQDALARNRLRPDPAVVPDRAILGTSGRLERPTLNEGFDELRYISIGPAGEFIVQEWNHEL